jgi:hypothetical protein
MLFSDDFAPLGDFAIIHLRKFRIFSAWKLFLPSSFFLMLARGVCCAIACFGRRGLHFLRGQTAGKWQPKLPDLSRT